jgi:Ca-activated chloride channel family protein
MTTPTRTTFAVHQDRRYIRHTAHSHRFLVARIEAPRATGTRVRPPVNLAIVLDRSGSMSGAKIDIAKRAVEEAIARLGSDDRFSVVVYDDRVDVVAPSARATADARAAAVERLRSIDARGSTNLGEGWLRGCEQVAAHLTESGVDRCLLLTDGLANVGITDAGELAAHAAALRARGVTTSTFGVGNDFDERLLSDLADAGGGHFYYIADAPQIRDAITSEVGETLEIVARDVTIDVTARDDIRIDAITPQRVVQRGGRTSVQLGDLGSEQVVEVVLRLSFPYGELGQETGVILHLADRDGVLTPQGSVDADSLRFAWVYADHRTNDDQARDPDVDRVVARVFAARARQEAVGLNRDGRFDEASRVLKSTGKRVREYAGRDPELLRIADTLLEEEAVYAAPMAESSRKQRYYASANLVRSRDAQGRAMRGTVPGSRSDA